MENREDIWYNGKIYPSKVLNINGYGERRIATTSLEDVLFHEVEQPMFGKNGNYIGSRYASEYVSDDAREIDELIFYYVDDEDILKDDKALAKQVEEELR